MKNIVLVIVGLIFLLFAAICPFPSLLSVSGVIWRMIIGFISCFVLVMGIYKTVRKR